MLWQKKITDKTELRFWLSSKKSLSKRIKNIAHFRIMQVKPPVTRSLKTEEIKFRGIRSTQLYIREVMIYANGQPIMYARTVTPKKNLRGFWGRIKRLEDNPLSDIIFDKKIIKRSPFIFRRYSINDDLTKSVRQIGQDYSNILVSRQSMFDHKKKKVLLTEVFFKNYQSLNFNQ